MKTGALPRVILAAAVSIQAVLADGGVVVPRRPEASISPEGPRLVQPAGGVLRPWEVYKQAGDRANDAYEYMEAERLYLLAIEQARSAEKRDPRRLKAIAELGLKVYRLGHPELAFGLLKDTALEAKQFLGARHPLALKALRALAEAATYDGWEHAVPWYRELLELEQAVEGPDGISVAKTLHDLGSCHLMMEEYEDAALYYRRAVEIRQMRLGIRNKDTLHSLSLLAFVLAEAHREQEAEAVNFHRFGLYLEDIWEMDTEIATDLEAVAQSLISARPDLLSELASNASSVAWALHRALDDGSERTLACELLSLGDFFLESRHPEQAERAFSRSLSIYQETEDAASPDPEALLGVATALKAQDRHVESVPAYRRAVFILEERLSASVETENSTSRSPRLSDFHAADLIRAMEAYSSALEGAGRDDEAAAAIERSTDLRDRFPRAPADSFHKVWRRCR